MKMIHRQIMYYLLLATAIALAWYLSGCADFGHYVSALDVNGGVSADPNNPDNAQVTLGGKIYFRDPQERTLPNYSKDK